MQYSNKHIIMSKEAYYENINTKLKIACGVVVMLGIRLLFEISHPQVYSVHHDQIIENT